MRILAITYVSERVMHIELFGVIRRSRLNVIPTEALPRVGISRRSGSVDPLDLARTKQVHPASRRGGTVLDRVSDLANPDPVEDVSARDWPGTWSDTATVYPKSV
jgi:hypothetical protein